MYSNIEDLRPEDEKDLSILENHIAELFTLLEKKEMQLYQLKEQNSDLKNQIQSLQKRLKSPQKQLSQPQQQLNRPQQQLSPTQDINQQTEAIVVPNQQISLDNSPSTSYSTNKRKCPKCGAVGFAIKEVYDKTRLISYVPRRIYAKKRVCTKCRYEF